MTTLSIIESATGRVLYTMTAYGPAAHSQEVPDGCYALPVELDPATQWVDGGNVMSKPPPPDEPAAWDWESKTWKSISQPPNNLDIEARAKRANMLALSDWTQLPDVPSATRVAWVAYRQALRDITDQPGYPETIHWPSSP